VEDAGSEVTTDNAADEVHGYPGGENLEVEADDGD